MVLARLLGPKDYGLVGMVTAFTGVLSLFRDFGLSSAAVQRTSVTEQQISTLFWINILVGTLLGLLTVAMAPALAAFYHEPRLFAVTCVLATAFLLNAAGVQHWALLQRQMRFTALAVTNSVALLVGAIIAICAAKAGYGYWALVAMTVSVPVINLIGLWLATLWVPRLPRRTAEIRSMMRFGGIVTLNGLVVYIATNFEKVLLGRFWGADAIGIYGRAYQFSNIPTDNLNTAAGEVAFSALSRLQSDPIRLRNYFLKGYSLVVALTMPITVVCALFADDIIFVFLGPKWREAAAIFRLLAPTILVFAIVNPLSWLLTSIGLVGRLLKIALIIAPFMIGGYVVGLPYGPKGVAFAYSTVMTLSLFPLVASCVRGTVISSKDMWSVLSQPLASSIAAGGLAFGASLLYSQLFSPLPRLILECAILFGTYLGLLLFVAGQKSFYLDLLRGLRGSSPVSEKSLVSA